MEEAKFIYETPRKRKPTSKIKKRQTPTEENDENSYHPATPKNYCFPAANAEEIGFYDPCHNWQISYDRNGTPFFHNIRTRRVLATPPPALLSSRFLNSMSDVLRPHHVSRRSQSALVNSGSLSSLAKTTDAGDNLSVISEECKRKLPQSDSISDFSQTEEESGGQLSRCNSILSFDSQDELYPPEPQTARRSQSVQDLQRKGPQLCMDAIPEDGTPLPDAGYPLTRVVSVDRITLLHHIRQQFAEHLQSCSRPNFQSPRSRRAFQLPEKQRAAEIAELQRQLEELNTKIQKLTTIHRRHQSLPIREPELDHPSISSQGSLRLSPLPPPPRSQYSPNSTSHDHHRHQSEAIPKVLSHKSASMPVNMVAPEDDRPLPDDYFDCKSVSSHTGLTPLKMYPTRFITVDPATPPSPPPPSDNTSIDSAEPIAINVSPSQNREFWRFQKGMLLGKGAFGKVYEAIRLRDCFHFAVKIISFDPEDVNEKKKEKLMKEIDIMSSISHRHCLKYFGSQEQHNSIHIFLELAKQSLTDHIKGFKQLGEPVIRSYTKQILLGLAYLHSHGIIHRDIKSGNILVGLDGLIKLGDFGSSKNIQELLIDPNNPPSVEGTPWWMAPEVAATGIGEWPADIWSVGCVIVEMITGQMPYHGKDRAPALYQISNGILPEFPDDYLSPVGLAFLKRCLEVDPNNRPAAAELLQDPWLLPVAIYSPATGRRASTAHSLSVAMATPRSRSLSPNYSAASSAHTPDSVIRYSPFNEPLDFGDDEDQRVIESEEIAGEETMEIRAWHEEYVKQH